jgi:hypothetical protein
VRHDVAGTPLSYDDNEYVRRNGIVLGTVRVSMNDTYVVVAPPESAY